MLAILFSGLNRSKKRNSPLNLIDFLELENFESIRVAKQNVKSEKTVFIK